MVSKIFLGVALVSTLAFVAISVQVGNQVEGAVHRLSRESAVQMADLVRSSIEQAMLSGNGIKVKRLIEQLKKSVIASETEIHIYDPQGIEVFAPKPPAPAADALVPEVARLLRGEDETGETSAGFYRRIPMEPRCAAAGCHAASDPLRGVLSMRVATEGCRQKRPAVIADIVKSGFIHLMTARRSDQLDEYFADIRTTTPTIAGVAVYDAEGDPSFGDDLSSLGVSTEQVLDAMTRKEPTELRMESSEVRVMPLMREARCVECHAEPEQTRGALLVALLPEPDPQTCDSTELLTLIDTSLRHIMTSELGRMIALFLDSVARTEGVQELVLYDNQGREYWNTTHPVPDEHISAVLRTGQPVVDLLGTGDSQRLRVVETLDNSERCARCHGAESAYRGLVEVSLSTRMAATTRRDSKQIIMLSTAVAALAMLCMLVAFLHVLLVRPVREIAQVAHYVGEGNLNVSVGRANKDGDEVARLGERINAMVADLRAKFNLEKFVSKGAARAAHAGGVKTTAQGGERTEATVLFSDIRGFTAYSETVSAERVVRMLNGLLKAQTDVVHHYGGDVDKFVGDELMAVFQGEDSCRRASECGLAMIEAVKKQHETNLAVGIGISTGEVVLGAIGHEDRLDFTVIGDVVNTGARLCSAAQPNCVLVTEAVFQQAEPCDVCEFEALAPIDVKGKKDPLIVYAVRSKSPPAS